MATPNLLISEIRRNVAKAVKLPYLCKSDNGLKFQDWDVAMAWADKHDKCLYLPDARLNKASPVYTPLTRQHVREGGPRSGDRVAGSRTKIGKKIHFDNLTKHYK